MAKRKPYACGDCGGKVASPEQADAMDKTLCAHCGGSARATELNAQVERMLMVGEPAEIQAATAHIKNMMD